MPSARIDDSRSPALRLIDWFIPESVGQDSEHALLQGRLLVVCGVTLAALALGFSWTTYHYDPDPGMKTTALAFGSVVTLAPLLYLKNTGRLRRAAQALTLEVLVVLLLLAFSSKGLRDVTLWLVPLAPVLGAFLAGPRFGFACAVIIDAALFALYEMHQSGHDFLMPGPRNLFFIAMACGALVTVLGGFAWVYETTRAKAAASLGKALAQLQHANEQAQSVNAALARARDAAEADARRKSTFLAEMRRLAEAQGHALRDTRASMAEMDAAIKSIASSAGTLARAVDSSTASMTTVDGAGQQLGRSTRTMVEAVGETAASIEEMNASIARVAGNVDGLLRVAEKTQGSMNDTEKLIADVESHASSTATLAERVIEDAARGREAVRRSLRGTEEIRDSSSTAARLMQGLGQKISNIGSIVSVIGDVADQTNLLSLNAAIIAAQAGESGKGFGVVADEIKSLAGRTNASTKEIGELIHSIQQESQALIDATMRAETAVVAGIEMTREAEAALEKIVHSAEQSTTMVRAIAEATDRQARGTRAVAAEMGTVTRTVNELAASTAEQARASTQIMTVTSRMREMVKTVESAIGTQQQNSEQVRLALAQINQMTRTLNSAQADQSRGSERILGSIEKLHTAQMAQVKSIESLETTR
jgi:methyl-accepting chemotaxis protein